MKKTHNPPPLHGQRSITILLIWMMYARKERGGGGGGGGGRGYVHHVR